MKSVRPGTANDASTLLELIQCLDEFEDPEMTRKRRRQTE
jgi:hypothetical protein